MKKVMCLVMAFIMVFAMTACGGNIGGNTSMAFTFAVNTGDNIKIELDTTDRYSLTSDIPFVVSHKGDVLSQGAFIIGDGYVTYLDLIESDEDAKVIESGEKNGYEYTMWEYADKEWNYAIHVSDATAIIIGNNVSEESAHEVFARLTISVENK